MWYFSFSFLINWQQCLHFCFFLSRWGAECTLMRNKMNFFDFDWFYFSLILMTMWYFSFSFLINVQTFLHFSFFLSRWGAEWTFMRNKMNFFDFSKWLQWNKEWLFYRGLNTFRTHCIQKWKTHNSEKNQNNYIKRRLVCSVLSKAW